MLCYLPEPMRQIVVPQSGHLPLVIGLPFLVVLSTGSFISFLARHLTQYASIAIRSTFLVLRHSNVKACMAGVNKYTRLAR